MSAEPLTREAAYEMFKEVVGKAAQDLEERNRAHVAEAIKVVRDDLEARGKERLIDQVRANGGKVSPDEEDGLAAGRFVRVFAGSLHKRTAPINIAKDWARKERGFESVVRALEAQSAENGGMLIPEPVLEGITDILRAQMVVESSGVSYVPMPNGNLSMTYKQTSSTASHIGERAVIPLSNPTTGRLKLSSKKLAARVIISNDLLRFASTSADAFVRDDLVDTIAVRKDLALLRDNGTENTPKGIRWLAQPANVVARTLDTGAVTLGTVTTDLANCAERLESGNIPMRRPGWIFSPRTKWFLFKLRDSLGNQVFRDEMSKGTIFGYPFRTTTNVPNNLSGAGDESEIYLVDFDSIVVGESTSLELAASDTGDGFSQDDTHIRAILGYDINARYRGAEISIVSGVDWV